MAGGAWWGACMAGGGCMAGETATTTSRRVTTSNEYLMSPCVPIVNPKLLLIFSSHHVVFKEARLINISTRNAVCVINGRHLSHCSGRYASYWNAFLFCSFFNRQLSPIRKRTATMRKWTNRSHCKRCYFPLASLALNLCKLLRATTSDTRLTACCNVCQWEYPNPY